MGSFYVYLGEAAFKHVFYIKFLKNKHHCVIKIMKTVRILRVESFKRAE